VKAKDRKEFEDVWAQEVGRASLLWNSLPHSENERLRKFLKEYKDLVAIAADHTYGLKGKES